MSGSSHEAAVPNSKIICWSPAAVSQPALDLPGGLSLLLQWLFRLELSGRTTGTYQLWVISGGELSSGGVGAPRGVPPEDKPRNEKSSAVTNLNTINQLKEALCQPINLKL